MAQWLACWAHNSKVGGSKPLSASFRFHERCTKENDDHGRTRTYNLRFRRPTPYPLGHAAPCAIPKIPKCITGICCETHALTKIKPMAGFEPTTSRLLSGCSTAKLHWRVSSGTENNSGILGETTKTTKSRETYFVAGLNRRPPACEAGVIATRPTKHLR